MARWTVGVVVAITLVVGGCGGGGSKKASTTGTTAAGKTATSQASSSGGGGEFCSRARAYAEHFSSTFQKDFAQVAANPTNASLRDVFKRDYGALKKAADDLVSKAPSAIKADMDSVFALITQLYDALAKVDFDFSKLVQSNPQFVQSLQDPKFQAAATRLNDYFTNTCHITTTTSK